MANLKKAAYEWWKNKRPIRWSESQHLENPTVNTTTDVETILAAAVAAEIRKAKKKRSGK